MADQNDTTRLIELLISRQDKQEQQLDKLTVATEKLAETCHSLAVSIAKTDETLLTFGKVQVQIIDRLDAMYTEQVRFNTRFEGFIQRQEAFNDRQEAFSQRQDDFNIIFLEEIRGMKGDIKELRTDFRTLHEITLKEHDTRLRRLEDFMNGLQNAA